MRGLTRKKSFKLYNHHLDKKSNYSTILNFPQKLETRLYQLIRMIN